MNHRFRLIFIPAIVLAMGLSIILTTPTASAQTPVPGIDLVLTKSHVGNFQVLSNGIYTLTVTNQGDTASGLVTLVDSIPVGLTYVSGVGAGWTCPAGPTPGPAPITCTQAGIAGNGGVASITLTVIPGTGAYPSVTNQATVSTTGDVNNTNDSASDPTTVDGTVDLKVFKSHVGNFTIGNNGQFTIRVQNNGTKPTSGQITLTDTLPTGLTFVSISGSGWTCSPSAPTCTYPPGLIAFSSAPDLTLTVNPTQAGSLVNSVTATTAEEAVPGDNTATDTVQVDAPPDLIITKAHTPEPFIVGDNGTINFTVTNQGLGPTTAQIRVTDTLPATFSYVALGSGGSGFDCSLSSGPNIDCRRNTFLAAAGVATFPVVVAVNAVPTPNPFNNIATVATTGDSNNANNNSPADTITVNTLDLSITKTHTGNFTVGTPGTFTITVANVGTGPLASANVGTITITDTLPAGLTFVSGGAGNFTCSAAGQVVTCTDTVVGDIAPGANVSFTIVVDVLPAAYPSVSNTADLSTPGDSVIPGANGNNRSTDTVSINGYDLVIDKSHSGNFAVGVQGTYFIRVTNNSTTGTPSSGLVTVTDTFPTGLNGVTVTSAVGWTCNVVGQDLTCTRSDALPAGASYPDIIVVVTPDISLANTTVNNTAQFTNTNDLVAGNNSDTDPTTIGGAPPADLSVTKSHAPNPCLVGAACTYTITVSNVGGGPSSGLVTLTDNVPATFGSITVTSAVGWTCGVAGQVVTCTRSDALAAGAAYPDVVIDTTPSTTAGSPFTNTTNVSLSGDSNPGNNQWNDPTTVNPANAPDLAITKTHATNFTVATNGTYDIVVSNAGTVAANGPFTITETLPNGAADGFDMPTQTFPGGWTCTVVLPATHPIASFTCTNPQATLAGGASLPTLQIVVNPPVAGTFTNQAQVAADPAETNLANNTATDPTTVTTSNQPDTRITKTHTGNFTAGQQGQYTITVSNIGSTATPGGYIATVTDTLPIGMTYVSGTGIGWTCSSTGPQNMTCTNATTINPGASLNPITLTVQVLTTATSPLINSASVNVPTGDPNTANNTATDSTVINGAPDLSITKTHVSSFPIGGSGTYTITVQNVGSAATTGSTTVTDTLPAGIMNFQSGGGVNGWNACTAAGNIVTCVHPNPITAGETTTFNINVTIPSTVTQGTYNNVVVVANASDVNGANNTYTDPTPVISGSAVDVSITKTHTGNFTIGGTGTYTITVRNVGTAPSGALQVTDTLPAGALSFVSATGGGFTCSAAANIVTCDNAAGLAVGASATITLTVNVTAASPTTVTNTAAITAPPTDVNPADNIANDSTQIVAVPPASAANSTITALPNSVPADGVTTTTITVTVRDASNNPLVGKVVNVSTDTGMPAGLAISGGGTCTTGAGGTCTLTATSTVVQTVNFRATVPADGVTITNGARTVQFTQPVNPNALSPTLSSISAVPNSVLADGVQYSLVTVTVMTNGGTPAAGATVTIYSNPTGPTATPSTTQTTNGAGQAIFYVRDTNIQIVTISAQATNTFGTITLTQTAQINFYSTSTATPTSSGAASATTSTFTTNYVSIPADNVTTATLTATIRNSGGAGLSGKNVTVTWTPALAGMTLQSANGTATGTTDSNGVVTFTVRSVTQGGPVTFTATDTTDSITIAQTVQITFTAPGTAPVPSTTGAATGTATPVGALGLLGAPGTGPSIGVVVPYLLCVRTGPGTNYPAIGRLKGGTQIVLLGKNPPRTARNYPPRPDCQRGAGGATWFLIQLDDNQVGWVSAYYIRIRRLQYRHLPVVDVADPNIVKPPQTPTS